MLMAVPTVQPAFSAGEIGPGLFGRTDIAKTHVGLATGRNGFVSYRGGWYSRAGTALVGYSKQTGSDYPPRLITFQYSINQGMALEFGHLYMRVILNGGYVLEDAGYGISAATKANPCVLTYTTPEYADGAEYEPTSVIAASYAPDDLVTIAGGVSTTPAVVKIVTTQIYSLALVNGGSGFSIGQVLPLVGGAQSSQAYITVTGIGGGGAITTFTVSTPGAFLQNAGTLTVSTVRASAATFTPVYAPSQVEIETAGAYSVTPANPAAQASTTGSGSGATFNLTYAQLPSIADGDWIYVSGVGGMTQLNGRTFVAKNATGTTVELTDVFGANINSTGYGVYTAGGLATRVYTLPTPWREQDLDWLKVTQSADVMSICCVNQVSRAEYLPYDLTRLGGANWQVEALDTSSTIDPPATCAGSASAAGAIDYQYRATAVNPDDGSESVASPIAKINGAVDISATAGMITLTCAMVEGVNQYNWYKASPGYNAEPPVGAIFGYAGTTYGPQFIDTNIVADFAQVPPLHTNPFARGQVLVPDIVTPGSGMATCVASITSSTGTGAILECVLVGGALVAFIVVDPGKNYLSSDSISFAISGGGAVAPTATMNVGAQTGTYPGLPAYFQGRRGYMNTLNSPDTYWFSQQGAYKNFDRRIPTIDSDAVTGAPWAQQVNGIQWAIPMPSGLVVMTGLSAWQLSGAGGNNAALTPASQQAASLAYNGANPTVPPLRIDNYILYLQSKGLTYRLLGYNTFNNIDAGSDHTIYSPQLFQYNTIIGNAYCAEPYKTVWAVRNDGVLLCDTFLPAQEINGWTRHDTQGLYKSVCSVVEPPVDALYAAVKRKINGQTSYMIERFNNRLWTSNENCWCVDAGLSLAQPEPAANLSASESTGAITGYTDLVGGEGYGAATEFYIADQNGGPGSGATVTGTIVGGVVTALAIGAGGNLYANPIVYAYDPSGGGSGFSAALTVNQLTTLTADAAVFALGDVGSVVRMNGGRAVITAYIGVTSVTARIVSPFVSGLEPLEAESGQWTMTAPVSSVGGLWHLAGADVVGTADGAPFASTVDANGDVALPGESSNVIVGLGFTVQGQSVYLQDHSGATVQGRRKKAPALVARVESSWGFTMGSNQIDGSTLNPPQIAPRWMSMQEPTYDYSPPPYGLTTPPLYTGDVRLPIQGDWRRPGQIAVQQTLPLPLNLLALIPDIWEADEPEKRAKRDRQAE